VILTRNIDSLNEVLYQLQMEAKFVGLDINHNKTEFMRNIKNYTNNTIKVILSNVPYVEVSCFMYLGSVVTYNNNNMIGIKDRMPQVNVAYKHLPT